MGTQLSSAQASHRGWSAAVVVAFIGMVAVNGLANALPINGLTTGAISDSYPIRFVPAGYVFSIWGLIYLGLAVFVVAQWTQAAELAVSRTRSLFVLSCALNAGWIVAWHYLQLGLSVVLMLGLLSCLITIYRRQREVPVAATSRGLGWALRAPVSVYLGWICVATIANLSALLHVWGWRGQPLDEPTWAAVMMVVATVLVISLAVRFDDLLPPLVLVWALVGIVVKFPGEGGMRLTGSLMVAVLLAGVGWLGWRALRHTTAKPSPAR